MTDRIHTLERISGLMVKHRREKNSNVFEFYLGERIVKTCFTYDKARLFAEGIAFYKNLLNLT